MLNIVKENLDSIPNISIEGIVKTSFDADLLRNINPDLFVISDDLSLDDILSIAGIIRKDRIIEHLPILFVSLVTDSSKLEWLFEHRLIDEYLMLNISLQEKIVKINLLIRLKTLSEKINNVQIENEYLKSEMSNIGRKKLYLDKKKNIEDKTYLIDLMHYIRTYLTGIKEGFKILTGEDISLKTRKTVIDLVRGNITKFEELVNDKDLTVNEEKKQKIIGGVIQIKKIFEDLSKRTQFEGRKKSISVFFELPDRDYSVLSKSDDLEFAVETLVNCFINTTKIGSVVKVAVIPQTSSSLIEISVRSGKDSIQLDEFRKNIEMYPEIIQSLSSSSERLSFFEDADFSGVKFYIPRLS